MKSAELKELEQMALLAELGRPLVHECNNFLNNLFLQMAILVAELPAEARTEWASIRREGKKVANLLQEWQRHRPLPVGEPEKIDLNQVLQEIVADRGQEAEAAYLETELTSEPLWLFGFKGDLKRLSFLLLHHALGMLEADDRNTNRALVLQTGKAAGKVQLQIFEAGTAASLPLWREFDEAARANTGAFSLIAAACQSLAERLQGSLRLEKRGEERIALIAEFAAAVS